MKQTLCFLIFLLRLICLQFALVDVEMPGEYVLPPNMEPDIYDLNLVTDLYATEFSYGGDVTITVKCTKKTTDIVLFAKTMTIHTEEITVKSVTPDGAKTNMKIADRQHQIYNDLLVIVMEDQLVVDNTYEIYIRFENNPVTSEKAKGYYSITYGDANNEDVEKMNKKLAINYFDSKLASRVFPCFDQMNLKAKFKITHVHDKSVTGFSTMKLLTSEPVDGSDHKVKDLYEVSDKISPFVVAIALADFTSRRKETLSENTILEIWADEIENADIKFLGDMAVHAFKYHSKHFGVDYALSKLDILIIPDYQPWNEEKYGLIVMNETFLLSPKDWSNDEMKFQIALSVCQAVGQQWIGTYTTMSWWNEYWLHEALLLFKAMSCIEKAFDGYDEQFVTKRIVTSFTDVLKFDAEITSVPIMQASTNKFDRVEKFIDKKLKEKAHQLFRTMQYFLGEVEFEKCITNYLKQYKFGTSNLDDVWQIFTTTANAAAILPRDISMKNIMDRFIYKSGYPLIDVSINIERNMVTFTQKRFILPDKKTKSESENDCWIFPISFITKNRLKGRNAAEPVRHWLTCDNSEMTVTMSLEEDEWILLDYPLGVFARVKYEASNWISLGRTLHNDKEYENIDYNYRIRLILDMFELPKIGKLDYDIAFENMMYVQHERNYFAWNEAMVKFMEFRLCLLGSTALEPYETYVRHILKSVFMNEEFHKIDDLPEKNHPQFSYKTSVVSYSCIFNVEDCREQSLKIYDQQLYKFLDQSHLGPLRGIRRTILCELIRHDKTQWNSLFELYSPKNDADLNEDILEALSYSTDGQILRKYLSWSVDSKITTQESVHIFRSISNNAIGYKQMNDFFFKEFEKIRDFFNDDISSFQDYLRILFGATTNEDDLIQLRKLIDAKYQDLKDSKTVLTECLAQATRNVLLLRLNERLLSKLFKRLVTKGIHQKFYKMANRDGI